MNNQTVLCPECGRVVKVRYNKFGDAIYARHRINTLANLFDPRETTHEVAEAETYHAPNPLAFGAHEIDCPNSGQPI